MTSKLLVFVLLLSSFGMAQGVAGDPSVGEYVASGGGGTSITFAKDCGGIDVTSNSDSITGCNFTNGNTIFVGTTIFNSSATATATATGAGSCSQIWTDNNALTSGNNYWWRCDVATGMTAISISYTSTVLHATSAGEFTGSAAFTTDATAASNRVASSTNWTASVLSPTASKYEVILSHVMNYSDNTSTFTCATGTKFAQQTSAGAGTSSACYQIVTSTTGTYTPNGTVTAGVNTVTIAISARVN